MEKNKIKTEIRWYSKGKLKKDAEISYNFIVYDDFITDDKFRDFLISNDVYEEYIKYSRSSFITGFKNNPPFTWIDYAFTWSDTGDAEKWRKLDRMWRDIYDKEY